ncbi:hypothetical protein [Noviherbaspirillum sp. ST9]|uniref:hypothetical protein n=1 Tax=Noviherbaspirillum sp. ST9 TaxID=3401606 RepID=UPI003B58AA2C
MDDKLTKDEYEALAQIRRLRKGERESACVARNAKRLVGLKYVTSKGGVYVLTEKGQQTLFLQRCIDGLRAVAYAAPGAIEADVATFLSRKGLIAPRTVGEGFDVTERGRESLADIDARENKSA